MTHFDYSLRADLIEREEFKFETDEFKKRQKEGEGV